MTPPTLPSASQVVSEDPVAVSLAMKHEVDIVISSSGLNTLLDNQPPGYRKQWILPITVQRQQGLINFKERKTIAVITAT